MPHDISGRCVRFEIRRCVVAHLKKRRSLAVHLLLQCNRGNPAKYRLANWVQKKVAHAATVVLALPSATAHGTGQQAANLAIVAIASARHAAHSTASSEHAAQSATAKQTGQSFGLIGPHLRGKPGELARFGSINITDFVAIVLSQPLSELATLLRIQALVRLGGRVFELLWRELIGNGLIVRHSLIRSDVVIGRACIVSVDEILNLIPLAFLVILAAE